MFRSSQILLVASALLVWSCEADDDSGTTENGGAGAGGESNSGASAGTQSAGSPSAGEMAGADTAGGSPSGLGGAAGSEHAGGTCGIPECCAVPDHKPCRGLSQQDCTGDLCKAVTGSRYNPADPMGEGGAYEPSYLGCHSVCSGIATEESCICSEDSPTECWRVAGAIPDEGPWVEFGCYADPPPELCEY